MKERPPQIKDRASMSCEAKRLQKLCEDEIERRRRCRGIPKEHWKYIGLEEARYKLTKVSHPRVVEAEVEVLALDQQKPSWDFYFFIGSVGFSLILGSYLFVGAVLTLLGGLF